MVRLVRACGSKQIQKEIQKRMKGSGHVFCDGQARKSLWIETKERYRLGGLVSGQARKSLWIETALFSQRSA